MRKIRHLEHVWPINLGIRRGSAHSYKDDVPLKNAIGEFLHITGFTPKKTYDDCFPDFEKKDWDRMSSWKANWAHCPAGQVPVFQARPGLEKGKLRSLIEESRSRENAIEEVNRLTGLLEKAKEKVTQIELEFSQRMVAMEGEIEKLTREIAANPALLDPTEAEQEAAWKEVYVMIDFSNIFIGTFDLFKSGELGFDLTNGRSMSKFMIDSIRLHDQLVDRVNQRGRCLHMGVIAGNDYLLKPSQLNNLKATPKFGRTMIIATGDANNNGGSTNFPGLVDDLLSMGWKVEIHSLKKGLGWALRCDKGANYKVCFLDQKCDEYFLTHIGVKDSNGRQYQEVVSVKEAWMRSRNGTAEFDQRGGLFKR
jgi:hypothetical protein